MQASTYQDVISRAKQLGRDLDLDLLFRTYLFIPRKLLRDTVRELGRGLDGKLIDVGCGTQQYRKFLRCDQYIGIDWSAEKRPTVVADVTHMPFRDRSFDSALCIEVLEHLPEPGRCLAEIHRVVKPGGMVLFTVPMTVHTHSEPHDFYRYTEYGLRYLLGRIVVGMALEPAVQEVTLEEPFTCDPGSWQPLFTDQIVDFFLIDIQILSGLLGVHQQRH